MSSYLIYTQLFIAVLVGVFVHALIRHCSKRFNGKHLAELKQRIGRWPEPAPKIWLLLMPFLRSGQRWARPSSRIANYLSVSGSCFSNDDREYVVFRNVMSLFSATVAGLIAAIFVIALDFPVALIAGCPVITGVLVFALLTTRVSDCYRRIQRQVSRGFPSFLDVLSLTLESGKNFQSALQMATQQLPMVGPSAALRLQLQELLRDALSCGSKVQALQRFSERLAIPEVVQFSAAVISAERQGVSVSSLLRRQAEQLRTSQALAAERHAMKLPVKLLAPLAICIFPCTFLVLGFPLAIRLSGSGLF